MLLLREERVTSRGFGLRRDSWVQLLVGGWVVGCGLGVVSSSEGADLAGLELVYPHVVRMQFQDPLRVRVLHKA